MIKKIKNTLVYKILRFFFKKIKLIIFLIYSNFIYVISGFIPRNNNIWVFGFFDGFTNNSKYFYEFCLNNKSNINAILITKNRNITNKLIKDGYNAYYQKSFKGLFYSLVAKVYIYDCYINDINYYTSRGAFKVNLWHGIPLKKIEFDINTLPLGKRYQSPSIKDKLFTPYFYTKPDLFLSTSNFVNKYSFMTAFKINKNRIFISNYPRIINLINESKNYEIITNKKFSFLYAPTWRDENNDFIKTSGFNFKKLNSVLDEMNALFLIKLHPNTYIDMSQILSFKNIKIVNSYDTNKLMIESDCLITDYSSIYFDYLWLKKPILFFPFDKEEYLCNREFYLDYEANTPGKKCYNFEELITAIINIKKDDQYMNERNLILKQFFDLHLDNYNEFSTLCNEIQRKISND